MGRSERQQRLPRHRDYLRSFAHLHHDFLGPERYARPMTLTLHPTLWAHDGPVLKHDTPTQYRVFGLPHGRNAVLIGLMNHRWRILHVTADGSSGWEGDYDSPQAALAAIQAE